MLFGFFSRIRFVLSFNAFNSSPFGLDSKYVQQFDEEARTVVLILL